MSTFARTIIGLASAAFIFPLSFMPDAQQHCSNPEYHFVMSDGHGMTIKDTTSAKESFCRVVDKNAELFDL